jgi:hypothetical protein
MGNRRLRLGASLILAGMLLVPGTSVQAESVWDISVVSSAHGIGAGQQADLSVACPAGRTPINGGYTAGGGDVRHSWVAIGFGSGEDYAVGIDNQGDAATVTVSVYCVPTSYFPNGRVVKFAEGNVATDHVAATSATCDTGYVPLNASISFSSAGGATVLTSVPFENAGYGWAASGWHELINSAGASSKIWLFVTCVPLSDVPGWKLFGAQASAGWGTLLTATCPSGAVAITGGGTQTAGDGQGIINESHRSAANQWSARMMSLTGGSMATRVVCIDMTPPDVAMTGPSTFTYGRSTTVTWTRSDALSGIASQALRSRSGSLTSAFGAWTTVVPDVSATSRTFSSLARGRTYCFAVQAVDGVTNASPWSAEQCTAIPLDDRDLTRSTGDRAWTAKSVSGWYRSTSLTTSAKGATLSIQGTVKRIELAAKKCPTCGVVEVWVGTTKVGTVNLKASTTSRTKISLPALASPTTGKIKIKVISSGKRVQIDALGLSRS